MSSRSVHLAVFLVAVQMSYLSALFPVAANASVEQEWRFKVYLDDRHIGYHHFMISQAGEFEQLTTEAQFDVEFLKIPLFKYRHNNTERWSSECLNSIASTTDQNGTLFRVDGSITDTGFRLSSNAGDTTLPACISTFAYWDKSFLQHDRLLNSQTGEYLEVDVAELSEQSVMIGNANVAVNRYRLTADKIDIEVWYSGSDQWLGLISTTDKGRLIRYMIE
jgi:hypothetical protein